MTGRMFSSQKGMFYQPRKKKIRNKCMQYLRVLNESSFQKAGGLGGVVVMFHTRLKILNCLIYTQMLAMQQKAAVLFRNT